MLAGHIAVALAAKRFEPQISLGTTTFAAMLPDFAWCLFLMAGIEHVQFTQDIGAANYLNSINISFSHSLLMDLIWAGLFAAAYYLTRHYWRGACLVFVVVLSHWLLDWVSHRPDMPLAPGVPRYFGLGLWTSVPATLIVEGGLWALGITLYVRATVARKRFGVSGFWGAIGLITIAWYNNIAGPPPSNSAAAPISSLIFFSLIVAWAYWINQLRPARTRANVEYPLDQNK
ncbi:MAG: metal-dependent hydrolase [Bryobacteraceae bacterium]